jgi:hypothetical protein
MYSYSVAGGGGEGIGGLRQVNTCRQVPLLVSFLEKPTFRVWCLYRYSCIEPTLHCRYSPAPGTPSCPLQEQIQPKQRRQAESIQTVKEAHA